MRRLNSLLAKIGHVRWVIGIECFYRYQVSGIMGKIAESLKKELAGDYRKIGDVIFRN